MQALPRFPAVTSPICCVLLMVAVTPALVRGASFTALGDLPGGSFDSVANGVSADGSVVAGRGTSASGFEAFRWTSGGGMIGLGDLVGGSFESEGKGISADGFVVVGQSNSGSGREAFRWTSGGGMIGLGDLTGGGFNSESDDVSADGSVVVGRGNSASGTEAFRWTSGGGMVGLGDITGGGFESVALGVSADGSVVAGRATSASGIEAFRWTSAGGMVGLGDLTGGSFESVAFGISADGSVVVGRGASASGNEAFRWTSGGGMVGLGDLPGGVFFSESRGVSADGSIIVGFGTTVSGNEAFIWDGVNGMRNLKSVLTTDFGLNLTGWTLQWANGVSSDGLKIVGFGTNPAGDTEAWLADLSTPVPEPGSLTLLGCAGGVLMLHALRRRRRHVAKTQAGRSPFTQFETRGKQVMNSAKQTVAISSLVFLTAALSPPMLFAETIYAVTWLGDLPGGTSLSRAFGINTFGQIAGESETAQGLRAFLWLPTPAYGLPAGMNNLGALPGSPSSSASDVNDEGQVVGEGFPPNTPEVVSQRAFRWQNGVMTNLGNASAGGINNGGFVVGFTQSPPHAALWDPAGNKQDIGGVLPLPDHTRGNAFKINDAGVVVGESIFPAARRGFYIIPEDTNGDSQPDQWFRDTNSDGINDLIHAVPLLPGATAASAFNVNSQNQVVGLSEGVVSHAFLYDIGSGVLTDLGDIPGGNGQNAAYSINNLSIVVGAGQDLSDVHRAFIWDAVNGMRDLNGLTDLSSGGQLTVATDINDSGRITGFGISPSGFTEAFLLTPVPEPGSLALLGLGTAALVLAAIKKHRERGLEKKYK